MQHLRRPEAGHDVGHAPPAPRADAGAVRDAAGQVLALGVVRPGGLLEVGEPGPVLDVEQVLPVPREDVRPAGELVVLVRLVDGEGAAGSLEGAGLELAHRGVDEVGRSRWGRGCRRARVGRRDPGTVAVRARSRVAHTTQVSGRCQPPRRAPPRWRRRPGRQRGAGSSRVAGAPRGSGAPPPVPCARGQTARRVAWVSRRLTGDISLGVNTPPLIGNLRGRLAPLPG